MFLFSQIRCLRFSVENQIQLVPRRWLWAQSPCRCKLVDSSKRFNSKLAGMLFSNAGTMTAWSITISTWLIGVPSHLKQNSLTICFAGCTSGVPKTCAIIWVLSFFSSFRAHTYSVYCCWLSHYINSRSPVQNYSFQWWSRHNSSRLECSDYGSYVS